jgi:hypothetical protein
VDNPWSYYDAEHKVKHDYLPELRRRLATRLVRAGRASEAMPLFEGELRGLCAGLLALEKDLDAATEEQRGDRLYALASFWYDQGKKLVFIDRYWHQWAGPSADNETARMRYLAEMDSMSVYHRAYPLYLELADKYPDDPHAPEALYKAALCKYWPTGQTYLKSAWCWEERARNEGYWGQGNALLRRLAETYPTHQLAQDPKVLRAVEAQ